jgi:hypothetical protein
MARTIVCVPSASGYVLRYKLITILAVTVSTAAPTVSLSQERTYQGTFQGAGTDPAKRVLGVSLALAEGYDELPDQQTPFGLPDQVQLPGYFVTMLPELTYQLKGKKLNVAATAGTNARYYNEVQRLVSVNHSATMSIGAQVTPRTDLFIGQSVAYSPAYLNRLFSTLGPSNTLDPATTLDPSISPDVGARTTDEGVTQVRSYAYGTTINLTRKIGRRAALTLTSGGRYTHFVNDVPEIPDLRGLEGGGYWSFAASRDVSFRFGYTYREAHFTQQSMSAEHIVDLGLALTHIWSPTRRTTFLVNAGPRQVRQTSKVFVTETPPALPVDPNGDRAAPVVPQTVLAPLSTQHNDIVGGVVLDHQIGRTWNVHGGFRRDVAYIEAIPNPVFSNTIDLSGGGYFSPRLDIAVAIGHSYGDSSFSIGVPSPFLAYNGNLRLRYALTRRWAVYSEYVYDSYEFEGTLPIPNGIAPRMTRRGIRAGLMLWVPVVRRR